jgi:hypothetical protein
MTQLNTAPNLLTSIPTLASACWPIKPCVAALLVVLAATAGAQTTQPVTPTFTEAGNAECAAIKKTAYERHAIRVALLKESGESDQIPAVEKNRDERVERLCALAFQTAADKQAAAADKQAAATLREMADVLGKLEKNPASQADLDRLAIVYAKFAALATADEKKNALPVFANVMRKLGVKVPGD